MRRAASGTKILVLFFRSCSRWTRMVDRTPLRKGSFCRSKPAAIMLEMPVIISLSKPAARDQLSRMNPATNLPLGKRPLHLGSKVSGQVAETELIATARLPRLQAG